MAKFKGVAFDLDGVITDTAVYHAQAWQVLCEKLGFEWTEKMADETKGISRRDSLLLILRESGVKGKYSEEEISELLKEKNEIYKELIQNLTPENILPGIAELLQDLKANNYHLVLASASFNAPVILEKLGLSDIFKGIVDPSNLVAGKPHPDIYLQAAKLMGVEPTEMLGIEDAKAGIEAINAACGMSVGIGDKNILEAADFCVSSTADLNLEVLEKTFS